MTAVARKVVNAMRRERRGEFNYRSFKAISDRRNFNLEKKTKLGDSILEREATDLRAHQLFEQLKEKGVKYSACVQAVKTKYVDQLLSKHAG